MKKPFQVGEQVFCSFILPGAAASAVTVRRTVLSVHLVYPAHPGKTGCTGWVVSADGGEPCPKCGRAEGAIPLIDSGYFTSAPNRGKQTAPVETEAA